MNKKLKVCYIISVLKNSTGKGGHFHSLKTLVDEIQNEITVSVIVIGTRMPEILESLNLEVVYVSTKWNVYAIFDVLKVQKIIKKIDPDVIHAYDRSSLNIINVLNLLYKKHVVFTKCGGENPLKRLFPHPYSKTVICFSEENLNYYEDNYIFRGAKFFYIPNRSKKIFAEKSAIGKMINVIGEGTVFLRIGRFSTFHKKSFEQTIALFKELSSHEEIPLSTPIKLVLIGAIESENVFIDLKRSCVGYDVFFFTKDEYTVEASRLINVGSFVIGTGRSLMEAAAMGKVLLSPIKNGKFPVLIDEMSFKECFRTNFSARNVVLSYDEKENINKIVKAIQNKEYKKSLEIFSYKMFADHFDIKKSVERHLHIYDSIGEKVSFVRSTYYMFLGIIRWVKTCVDFK